MRHPNPLVAAMVDAKDREYMVESGQAPATREELLRMAGERDDEPADERCQHRETQIEAEDGDYSIEACTRCCAARQRHGERFGPWMWGWPGIAKIRADRSGA